MRTNVYSQPSPMHGLLNKIGIFAMIVQETESARKAHMQRIEQLRARGRPDALAPVAGSVTANYDQHRRDWAARFSRHDRPIGAAERGPRPGGAGRGRGEGGRGRGGGRGFMSRSRDEMVLNRFKKVAWARKR